MIKEPLPSKLMLLSGAINMTKLKPWIEHPTIWKTESAFMSFLRGGIRRSLWNRSPIKLEFINKNRIRIPNPVAKNRTRAPTVWGGECALCHKMFAMKDLEVDHKTGNHSLRSLDDIQAFVEGIVCVSEKDLQLVCKPCHKAKSHAEKQGISFEDARIEKEVIAIVKAKKDKEWLVNHGLTPAKNAKLRRQQIIDYLKGG